MLLKQLYTFNSLENVNDGVKFSIKNRLSDASFTGLAGIKIDDNIVPVNTVKLQFTSEEIPVTIPTPLLKSCR